ncbi:MAG: prolipoprotein diacylglyceryl transferase [Luminiphilus sp.]|nr:prolipoprotein diacylglyceryl transferase [Luminiphilus sp.]
MIHYPQIDPVALSLGPISIYWYGMTYVGGLIFAWWLGKQRAQLAQSPVAEEQIDDLIFYAALGIVAGGRIGYALFYGAGSLWDDPLRVFRLWEGGMAFHGGFLGVVIAMWLFCRHQKIEFGALVDFIAPLAPVGLALGRIGNFINQELWGRPADVPWAMVFPADPLGLARHPSQLYQFAMEGVLLFFVLFWYTRSPRPRWSAAGLFLLGYGLFRSLAEFFREPDAHIGFDALGWMTRGQLLSLPMIAVGAAIMIWAYRRDAKK